MQLESRQNLQAMKNIDVRTVDRGTLVDINDVTVNRKLSQGDRLKDFVHQIGNPYCYKCGEAVIKVSFADTTATLEDRTLNYLSTFSG